MTRWGRKRMTAGKGIDREVKRSGMARTPRIHPAYQSFLLHFAHASLVVLSGRVRSPRGVSSSLLLVLHCYHMSAVGPPVTEGFERKC